MWQLLSFPTAIFAVGLIVFGIAKVNATGGLWMGKPKQRALDQPLGSQRNQQDFPPPEQMADTIVVSRATFEELLRGSRRVPDPFPEFAWGSVKVTYEVDRATGRKTEMFEVKVPDIGGFRDVPIIEVHIREGDTVKSEDPLITLESDKATMDVPAPISGTVTRVMVKIGDRVSKGTPIALMTKHPSQQVETPSEGPVPAA